MALPVHLFQMVKDEEIEEVMKKAKSVRSKRGDSLMRKGPAEVNEIL